MKKVISILLSLTMLISVFGGMGIVANAEEEAVNVVVKSDTAYTDLSFTYYVEFNGKPYSATAKGSDGKDIVIKDGYFKMGAGLTASVPFTSDGDYSIKRMAVNENGIVIPELDAVEGTVLMTYTKDVNGTISFITEKDYDTETNNGTATSTSSYVDGENKTYDESQVGSMTAYKAGVNAPTSDIITSDGINLKEEKAEILFAKDSLVSIPVSYNITATCTEGRFTKTSYNGNVSASTTLEDYKKINASKDYSGILLINAQAAFAAIGTNVITIDNDIDTALSTSTLSVARDTAITDIVPTVDKLPTTSTTSTFNKDVNYTVYNELTKVNTVYSKGLKATKTDVTFSDAMLSMGENTITLTPGEDNGKSLYFAPDETGLYYFLVQNAETDLEVFDGKNRVDVGYGERDNYPMYVVSLEKGKAYRLCFTLYSEGRRDVNVKVIANKGNPYGIKDVSFVIAHSIDIMENDKEKGYEYDGVFYYNIWGKDVFNNGDKMIVTYDDGTQETYTYSASDSDSDFVCGDKRVSAYDLIIKDDQEVHPWLAGENNELYISYNYVSYTTNVNIVPKGHSHSYKDVSIEVTCVTDGYTAKVCDCGSTQIVSTTKALGHSFTAYVENKDSVEPTCTKTGLTASKTAKCDRCDAIDTVAGESIVATGVHDYAVSTTNATCGRDGSKVYTCSMCNDSYSEVIKATGKHIYGSARVTTEATCAKNGVRTSTCIVCLNKKNETIPATGRHIYAQKVSKAPTSKAAGTMKYTCSICNGSYNKSIAKLANASVSKLTAQKKGFKVQWKKVSSSNGYQIRYSTKSNMSKAKTVTVNKYNTTSKSVTKLSAKKKYYVQIRTYKTINGKNYYSSWSKSKTVTTKK